MAEEKPKRRWFRFSLRALLVVVTVMCVWLGLKVNAARRQHEAVAAILKAGGEIGFDYQVMPSTLAPIPLPGSLPGVRGFELGLFSKYDLDRNAIQLAPAWLRDHIGSDYFRSAVSVRFILASAVKPMAGIDQLAKLPALKEFYLLAGYPKGEGYPNIQKVDFTALEDLKYLDALTVYNCRLDGSSLAKFRSLGRLTHVTLGNTGIDDAAMEQVGRMINLEYLWLRHTQVTDAGIAHLNRLTNLRLFYLSEADITDASINQLAGLNRLTNLWLIHTSITDEGIRKLQKSLPNCKISHW